MANKLDLFKAEPDQPDDEITTDLMVNSLVITGTVGSVVDQLLAFRDEIGDFGTLVYNGADWVERDIGRRSMELMATEVMPRLNDAIGN